MAKYSKTSQTKVKRAMHEMKEGKLKSGRSNKKVTNPKQAIAIGLSEAREKGAKVPARKGAAKKGAKKGARKRTGAKKSAPKKRTSSRRSAPKKRTGAKKSARKKTSRKRS